MGRARAELASVLEIVAPSERERVVTALQVATQRVRDLEEEDCDLTDELAGLVAAGTIDFGTTPVRAPNLSSSFGVMRRFSVTDHAPLLARVGFARSAATWARSAAVSCSCLSIVRRCHPVAVLLVVCEGAERSPAYRREVERVRGLPLPSRLELATGLLGELSPEDLEALLVAVKQELRARNGGRAGRAGLSRRGA
jgi:hypothetical protein